MLVSFKKSSLKQTTNRPKAKERKMKKIIFLVMFAVIIVVGCKGSNVNEKEVWEVTNVDHDVQDNTIVSVVKYDYRKGMWMEQKFPCFDKNYSFCKDIKSGWIVITKSGKNSKFFSPVE